MEQDERDAKVGRSSTRLLFISFFFFSFHKRCNVEELTCIYGIGAYSSSSSRLPGYEREKVK